jgi:hypothetical protein
MMTPIRTLSRSLLAVLVGAAALTGCTPRDDTGTTTSPSPAPPASVQLADAARHLARTSFAMKLTIALSQGTAILTGTMDPRKKVGAFTAATSGRGDDHILTQWRVLGTVLYAKTTTNGVAANENRPWLRLNNADTDGLATAFDGAAMAQALTKATGVRRSDGTHFTGTLDGATASTAFGVSTPAASPSAAASTPAAGSVAFTADIDNRGRLTGYQATLTTSTGTRRRATLAFSDFGVPVNVQAPPPDEIATSTTR